MKVRDIKKVTIDYETPDSEGNNKYTVSVKYKRISQDQFKAEYSSTCKDTEICPVCGEWKTPNHECDGEKIFTTEEFLSHLEEALNDDIGSHVEVNNSYVS